MILLEKNMILHKFKNKNSKYKNFHHRRKLNLNVLSLKLMRKERVESKSVRIFKFNFLEQKEKNYINLVFYYFSVCFFHIKVSLILRHLIYGKKKKKRGKIVIRKGIRET